MRIVERTSGRRVDLLPVWFTSRALRKEIEKILPGYYRRRFLIYFKKYGCIRCEQKSERVIYGGNGLCEHCINLIGDRFKRIDSKEKASAEFREGRPSEAFLQRRRAARDLLADIKKELFEGS